MAQYVPGPSHRTSSGGEVQDRPDEETQTEEEDEEEEEELLSRYIDLHCRCHGSTLEAMFFFQNFLSGFDDFQIIV